MSDSSEELSDDSLSLSLLSGVGLLDGILWGKFWNSSKDSFEN